ncbi:MAG: DNA-3-methyladenine glycosylase I [Planctomycetota bacterium]
MSKRAVSLVTGPDGVTRCWWCAGDPIYEAYHDTEWGFPCTNDQRLFESICLDGFQAGLSWITILRRREHFRSAFAGFEIERVARFNQRSVERLLRNDRIIRHRGKIESTINNAKRALDLIDEHGSLAGYLRQYEPKAPRPRLTRKSIPATTPESAAMSKDLKRRGWTFVGPTILYAMMQAVGVVNDHLTGCDIRLRVPKTRGRPKRPAIR